MTDENAIEDTDVPVDEEGLVTFSVKLPQNLIQYVQHIANGAGVVTTEQVIAVVLAMHVLRENAIARVAQRG